MSPALFSRLLSLFRGSYGPERKSPDRSRLFQRGCRSSTFLLLLASLACGGSVSTADFVSKEEPETQPGSSLTVFAASSLTEAFQEIARSYEAQRKNTSVVLNFDGSQRLRTQLEHGARAHIFASADWEQMDLLLEEGLASNDPVNFASNSLVFLLNADFAKLTQDNGITGMTQSDGNVATQIRSLSTPGTRIILAVEEAPVGRYSEELLVGIAENPELGPHIAGGIRANIVSRETNVRSVAQKVALGEADAGITYGTDALSDYVSPRVQALELAPSLNVTAHYPVVTLSEDRAASDFIEFLLSEGGQGGLRKHGFGPAMAAGNGSP